MRAATSTRAVYTREELLALSRIGGGIKHPIPTELKTLPNKCDELEALVRNQRLYKESSLICLSESWLNDNTPDLCVDIRADRDRSMSGKRKGRGIILCFNQRWVNPRNVTVKERICCPDIELLSVGFRAFYAPREFPYTVVIVVYIPLRAAPTTA